MKLEIKIKRPVNSKKIGTAAWTIEELKKSVYELKTLQDGNIAIVITKTNTIVCQEMKPHSDVKLFKKFYFSYEKNKLEKAWRGNQYQHAVACCAAEENIENLNEVALFGKVLTDAAKHIVDKFIFACAELLLQAIIERDEKEKIEVENFKFQIVKTD
ncbi:MAG: hypothetical protein LBF04_02275 [Prevotellaceae bacterium]|jgi:hypothetical protein|nr:hypothetical protein [Prevotellaceae bacterium]